MAAQRAHAPGAERSVERMSEDRLTHLDASGRARMVDVSGKQPTARTAPRPCGRARVVAHGGGRARW